MALEKPHGEHKHQVILNFRGEQGAKGQRALKRSTTPEERVRRTGTGSDARPKRRRRLRQREEVREEEDLYKAFDTWDERST